MKHLALMTSSSRHMSRRYTEEYALLISDVQAIKQELTTVEAKVDRSTSLLESLAQEKERWGDTSESFKKQVPLKLQ